MKEHDLVVLTAAVPAQGLEEGDVGTVVDIGPGGRCLVEFVNAVGDTIAVLALEESAVRPARGSDVLHVREARAI